MNPEQIRSLRVALDEFARTVGDYAERIRRAFDVLRLPEEIWFVGSVECLFCGYDDPSHVHVLELSSAPVECPECGWNGCVPYFEVSREAVEEANSDLDIEWGDETG